MPDKPIENKDTEEWITIGGKKMRVDAGEDKEELTREKMPSARGEKESNTKEAQKAVYKKRFDLIKSPFKPRDEVVFAEYEKSGVIAGIEGESVKILSNNRVYPVLKNHVFKKSELLKDVHWDTMTNVDRALILKSSNLPTFYYKQNWGNLDYKVREQLLKNVSPAGTTTSTTGIHNPIYNPINEEKTVDSRIKEEMERQHKDNGGKDEGVKKTEMPPETEKENPNRVSTPISILKSQKKRLRKYAQPDLKRKGNESDAVVLERVLREYETNHPANCDPKPTYSK